MCCLWHWQGALYASFCEVWSFHAGGPFDGFAEVGDFGGDVGADSGLEWDDVVENSQSVLAHFLAGEKLAGCLGEV